MGEQQLITDLAIAERNVKSRIKNYSVTFGNEVRNAFMKYHVNTYLDLVQMDSKTALQLRRLAVQEKLI